MKAMKMEFASRDANGKLQMNGTQPVQAVVIMKTNGLVIANNQTVYSMSFSSDVSKPDALQVFISSPQAADFFHYYEDVIYLSEPGDQTAPPPLPLCNANGTPSTETLSVTITLAPIAGSASSLMSYRFVSGGKSVKFNLTNADYSTFYGMFDILLASNPPNPAN